MAPDQVQPERILLTTVKRNVLLSKVYSFCIILALLHVVLDASQGLYESVVVDLCFAVIIGVAWLLNYWKYHRTSKVFVLFCLNLLFVFFTSVLPKEVGVYLYYFPPDRFIVRTV